MKARIPALALLFLIGGATLFTSGCARFGPRDRDEGEVFLRPAGVVREVNTAERYLIFESTFVFRPGQELQAMRHGRPAGTLRVLPHVRRPFFAADILEGAPRVDDLVE